MNTFSTRQFIFLVIGNSIVLTLGLVYLASAFIGPSTAPGVGSGSISTDATGRVGIGTTAPTRKLDIVGDTPVGITRGSGSQGKNSGLVFRDQTAGEKGAIGTEGIATNDLQILSAAGMRFYTGSDLISTNERMRIDSSGNIGIGTTAPGAKLEVAGQIKITGGVPGAGKVLTSDASGLATWLTPSSGGGDTGVTCPAGQYLTSINITNGNVSGGTCSTPTYQ